MSVCICMPQAGTLGGILLESRGGQEAPVHPWTNGFSCLVVSQWTRLLGSQCSHMGLTNPLCYFGLRLIWLPLSQDSQMQGTMDH